MISSFKISVTKNFRLDYTVWVLRRRANNIVDNWDGKQYRRVFVLNKKAVLINVSQIKQKNKSFLLISTSSPIDSKIKQKISDLLIKMFGLKINLNPFYTLASRDSPLKRLAKQFKGVKPVRFQSIFEALVNAIACQQLSLDVGIIILNRFCEKFGKRCKDTRKKIYYAFPTPDQIKKCTISELKVLGFSTQKSKTIIELSKAFSKNPDYFVNLSLLSNEDIIKALKSFNGIGRWSAEYTLLRGFGRIDVFPANDVGAQNNLKRIFHFSEKLSYDQIDRITKRWHPYEGFVYFHLLLNKLATKGLLFKSEERVNNF